MLLTITTTATPAAPATDLGFLLHKNPERAQSFEQSFGTAHVFYPEATAERCTAALLLEVDPQALLRARTSVSTPDFALAQYVNDRPFATSSLFTVALGRVFRSALKGACEARPELAAAPLPLELHLPAVPCRAGADKARALFEPLGWRVGAEPVPLDPGLPGWGDSHYLSLTLSGDQVLSEALSHLYVLLPAMDGSKHYWVDRGEIDKLLRAGGLRVTDAEEQTTEEDPQARSPWLARHPERAWITRRYLNRRNAYVRTALARLAAADDLPEEEADPALEEDPARPVPAVPAAEAGERTPSLAEQRAGAVLAVLRAENASSVLDLGCGPGALLAKLVADPTLERITGVDVDTVSLQMAHRKTCRGCAPNGRGRHRNLFADAEGVREQGGRPPRPELLVGSAVYRDARFAGHDAVVLMEVVEHVDPERLLALEETVFSAAHPRVVVVTTPNAEYNVHYEGLADGAFRHRDHRFEWTRAEFTLWADAVAERNGYTVRYLPVGPQDPATGSPTQMGVFTR
ncbi:3' terminal RNA ribose 2'-O-methyltransferase Hen1 [Nocardiopsis sp. CC223A]|uniref:3' terminal RNA ribose 2'-O-methyltransferase Hen1 n=1 Tax=Nocardiopsis sp. CC223A TaxID=3044051 RepID=UPI00278C2D87|nr:3' terminal RNA ribose 2'-O-methyltransferase Hen1 [Nocardiopsis sp. CC223A]